MSDTAVSTVAVSVHYPTGLQFKHITDLYTDYDLCTECISKPEVRLKHDLKHAFFPIPGPGDFASYRSALEQRKKSLGSHGLGEFLEVAAKATELMNTLVTGSS